MGTASLVLGILGMVFSIIGLIPLLGILNWIAGIFLSIGFILGIVGIIVNKSKGTAIAGTVICIIFDFISAIRLLLGGVIWNI